MYNSYYQTARIDSLMISSAKMDIVAYTKKKLAHDLIEKIMEDKEIDINNVVLSIKFAEFDVDEYEGMFPNPTFPYKEIQARLRVIPYA